MDIRRKDYPVKTLRATLATLAVAAVVLFTPAVAEASPRKSCKDTVASTNYGSVKVTRLTRVCNGARYVKAWVTVRQSGKTLVVLDTFPTPAPRRW